MFRSLTFTTVCFVIILLLGSYQQTNAHEKKDYTHDLFASDSLLQLYIHTNLHELVHDVGNDNEYHKARLSYYLGDSIVSLQIKIKTRGNFRKDRAICAFPPLKIKFSKSDCTYTYFHKQKKLKLVTHCQNRSERYQQMLLQEYLIYKLYNVLTPESFRVRLVKIHYQDVSGKMKPLEKFSFFIEDFEKMADRNHKLPRYDKNVHQEQTNIAKVTRLALFQYMIGNTDWGVPTLHNIKMISTTPSSRLIPVPYDFDWASLVNAPYAVPNEKLDIESIHERLYRGYQRTVQDLEFILREFRLKKEELYDVYRTCPYLSDKEKKRVLKYFDEFYKIINTPSRVKREFVDNARIIRYK